MGNLRLESAAFFQGHDHDRRDQDQNEGDQNGFDDHIAADLPHFRHRRIQRDRLDRFAGRSLFPVGRRFVLHPVVAHRSCCLCSDAFRSAASNAASVICE